MTEQDAKLLCLRLDELLAHCGDLQALLVLEREALENYATENLESILEKKETILNILSQSKIQFENLLKKYQLTFKTKPILDASSQHPKIKSLIKTKLEQLQSMSIHIEEFNLLNSHLIRMGQNQIQKLVQVIQGRGTSDFTYDQRGFSNLNHSQTNHLNQA
ncbi:MAG: flagellar export chaperone FlgN [Gammaproteobacteria bacterium]